MPDKVVEGIVYRYRCPSAWRDVPEVFGPWQTVWTWHRRMSADGSWDRVLARLLGAPITHHTNYQPCCGSGDYTQTADNCR